MAKLPASELVKMVASYLENKSILLTKIEKIEDEQKRKTEFDKRLKLIGRRMSLQEQYSRGECIEIANIPIIDDDSKL